MAYLIKETVQFKEFTQVALHNVNLDNCYKLMKDSGIGLTTKKLKTSTKTTSNTKSNPQKKNCY